MVVLVVLTTKIDVPDSFSCVSLVRTGLSFTEQRIRRARIRKGYIHKIEYDTFRHERNVIL